jgi:hypothetical protein
MRTSSAGNSVTAGNVSGLRATALGEPAGVMIRGQGLDRAALDQGLLAAPHAWLIEEVLKGVQSIDSEAQEKFTGLFATLADSLARVPAAARAG